MSKGLFGGMTDYSHQSIDDIVLDLNREAKNIALFISEIEGALETVEANGYWQKNVIANFKIIVAQSLKHYETALSELNEISSDIKVKVEKHHCKRLVRIATVAQDINVRIGKIWHQDYEEHGNKDYDDPNFRIVERVYADTRDAAVNLLDLENMAERLKDYIGRTSGHMKKNNPWFSGLFYLFTLVIIIGLLAVLSKIVHWSILPVIIIGGAVLIGIVGALQLKNDDKLKDETFIQLMIQTYKGISLLNRLRGKR